MQQKRFLALDLSGQDLLNTVAWSRKDRGDVLTISKSRSRYAVQIPTQLLEIPICRDLYGEPLLHLAIFGVTDYLVTGDRDLLCLVDIFDPPIVTAEQFLNIFMS